jgi:3',5'-nucleoside bisphosphate phosphatase
LVLLNEVDLHCHTTASDGALSPAEVVGRAAHYALTVIAVTDHDTTAGIAAAQAAAQAHELTVIPGVEINTDVPGNEVHVLGYFIDYTNKEFSDELVRLREGRLGRARRVVELLATLGVRIRLERVLEIAGGSVGRPHVAQAIIEAGYASTISEAFDRYLGRNAPAYVPRMKFAPTEACQLIRRAGGVPVLAHPVSFGPGGVIRDRPGLEALLVELAGAGLMGLEAYYPGYDAVTSEYLMGLARRHNLLLTGGSDFHGLQPEKADLGSVYVPTKVVRRLRAAWEGLHA